VFRVLSPYFSSNSSGDAQSFGPRFSVMGLGKRVESLGLRMISRVKFMVQGLGCRNMDFEFRV